MTTGSTSDKLKVFISYSRKDEDFAQDLLAGLEAAGFEPFLDRHDIAPGEDWEVRLARLIESADTVVFVISQASLASERCAWEIERAALLGKRLLPILWRKVDDVMVPQTLRRLNYIFFDRPQSFGGPLLTLAQALRTDVDWIREHTRIGEAALRWDGRGRAKALLMRGEELSIARAWVHAQPTYAPEPTLLMLEFIKAAEDEEAARATLERKRLDELAAALRRERAALRAGQRALAGAAAAFACVVVGALGIYYQATVMEQVHWRLRMGPSVLTGLKEKEQATAVRGTFADCRSGCPTLVVIPSGTFRMGSPTEGEPGRRTDEGPVHGVLIAKPFALGRTEVTFAEWRHCVRAGACREVDDEGWGQDDRPVMNVSWDDTRRYAEWLSRVTGKNYRLPMEAEWEYAARAGSTAAYAFGNDPATLDAYAWHSRDLRQVTAPVATKQPNAFGLHDMHGNVQEWVADCYREDYRVPAPRGDCDLRVARGGSWALEPTDLRAARRFKHSSGTIANDLGFRVARSLD